MFRKPSRLWSHFTPNRSSKGFYGKCHYCSKEISVKNWSLSNLKRHLKLHPVAWVELFGERNPLRQGALKSKKVRKTRGKNDSPQITDDLEETPEILTVESDLSGFIHEPESVSSERARAIDCQLLTMLVKGSYPLSLTDDPEFVKFVNMLEPGYQMPNKENLTERLLQAINDH